MKYAIGFITLLLVLSGCKSNVKNSDAHSGATWISDKIHYPQEKHMKNILLYLCALCASVPSVFEEVSK